MSLLDENIWLSRIRKPPYQAGIAASIMLLFLVFGLAARGAGAELSERFGYQVAATALLMFGIANALMSLGTNNVNRYWGISFVSYVALAGLGLLVAKLLSGLWISQAGSYRWIYSVLTFGYLVILSIMSMIRGIVNFAENEEWSQPRKRN